MIRKAFIKDADEIYEIIEVFAKKGAMLHRSLADIYSNLRDFFIYEENGRILGVAALHICWGDLSEVRTLAVRESSVRMGIGTKLVLACIEEARSFGIKRVFALTYKPEFFKKFDFKDVSKSLLPQKIWGDCIKCVKFPHCDENAVILDL